MKIIMTTFNFNIVATFVSHKANKFGQMCSYFKVEGVPDKKQLEEFQAQECGRCSDMKMPFFLDDKGDILLTVKRSNQPRYLNELLPREKYEISIILKRYSFSDKNMTGYSCILDTYEALQCDDEDLEEEIAMEVE